jgi:hypothetical protein
MRLTVVPIDGVVCKDGECLHDIDLSWIPEEVHAVQWYEDHGHVELKTPDPNIDITELGIYQQASDLWDAKKQEFIDAELNRDYLAELRILRDFRLTQSDWTQLPDNTLTEEQKVAWQAYRQELRDLTDNVTDPKSLVLDPNHPEWPVPPA